MDASDGRLNEAPAAEPDVRGWSIQTPGGRSLGTVADLLHDQDGGPIVMIAVAVPGSPGHTLVPIRVVHIDRVAERLLMDSSELVGGSTLTLSATGESHPTPDRLPDIVVDRPVVVDERAPDSREPEHRDGAGHRAATSAPLERRPRERRRIERMGTDL